MDILDAQDAPIVRTIKGKSYTFPVWTTRQLLPVLARLKDLRLKTCKKHLLAEGVDPLQRARALYDEEIRPSDPWDAHIHFMSTEGADECLLESLKRGGTPEAEAWDVIDSMRYEDKKVLSIKVAHIYIPAPDVPATTPKSTAKAQGQGFGEGAAPEQPKGLGEEDPTVPVPAGT